MIFKSLNSSTTKKKKKKKKKKIQKSTKKLMNMKFSSDEEKEAGQVIEQCRFQFQSNFFFLLQKTNDIQNGKLNERYMKCFEIG